MTLEKKTKILIFRSDRIGDLINTSSFIFALKKYYKNSEITLVCSSYNQIVARYYDFVDNIFVYDKNFSILKKISFIFKILSNSYDISLTIDGRSISYLVSYFLRCKLKYAICFKKHKFFFGVPYCLFRPPLFILKKIFHLYVFCDEDYSNLKSNLDFNNHYLTMYYFLLKKNNVDLPKGKHIYNPNPLYLSKYNSFSTNYLKNPFIVFHIDEKWNALRIDTEWLKSTLNNLSTECTIVVTSGLSYSKFFEELKTIYNSFMYNKNDLNINNKESVNDKILLLENLPLSFLSHFIKESKLFISSHSGAPFHIAAAVNTPILDFVNKDIDLELNRWIPLNINYNRVLVENYINLEKEIKKQTIY